MHAYACTRPFLEFEDEEETDDAGDGQRPVVAGGGSPRWLREPPPRPRRRHPGPPSFLEANGRGARVEAMPQCGPMISQIT